MICLRQNDVADLNTVMNTSAGMMSYFAKFWRGFYPLLIVELVEKTDSIAVRKVKKKNADAVSKFSNIAFPKDSKPSEEDPDFAEAMDRLHEFFGDVHHIQVEHFLPTQRRSMCDTDDIPTLSLALTDYHVLCDANWDICTP